MILGLIDIHNLSHNPTYIQYNSFANIRIHKIYGNLFVIQEYVTEYLNNYVITYVFYWHFLCQKCGTKDK
jgi:hypothetical protein